MRAALLAAALLLAPCAALAQKSDGDPDSPATQAAAEAAVARLGDKRARDVRGAAHAISGRVIGIKGLVGGVKATVKDLEAAKKDLGAKESELEVRVELPADVLFDVDKADIRPDAARALAQLATVVRAYSGAVALTGHTDSDGSDAHNLDLSKRRAESVKAWLVARESLPAARFATSGLGETKPVAPNDTAANKQRNRRVEVVVKKR
jgi:outer membrane protein OmpA-like peptidoglycan-associated protein